VSRPVKVAASLYASLRAEAEQRDISIQDALAQRITDADASVEELSTRCRELAEALRAKESELQSARNRENVEASRVLTLETEIRAAREALARADAERQDLAEASSELLEDTLGLEQTLARERASSFEKSRKQKRILQVAAAALLVAAAFAIWRQWKQSPAQLPTARRDPPEPAVPEIWAR